MKESTDQLEVVPLIPGVFHHQVTNFFLGSAQTYHNDGAKNTHQSQRGGHSFEGTKCISSKEKKDGEYSCRPRVEEETLED